MFFFSNFIELELIQIQFAMSKNVKAVENRGKLRSRLWESYYLGACSTAKLKTILKYLILSFQIRYTMSRSSKKKSYGSFGKFHVDVIHILLY